MRLAAKRKAFSHILHFHKKCSLGEGKYQHPSTDIYIKRGKSEKRGKKI